MLLSPEKRSEAALTPTIFVCRPINYKWLGELPTSYIEGENLKTEVFMKALDKSRYGHVRLEEVEIEVSADISTTSSRTRPCSIAPAPKLNRNSGNPWAREHPRPWKRLLNLLANIQLAQRPDEGGESERPPRAVRNGEPPRHRNASPAAAPLLSAPMRYPGRRGDMSARAGFGAEGLMASQQ
jgi:hypothetical protein